jgi:transposase
MLAALVAGETDPMALAELARGRLRSKLPALEAALTGRCHAHHRFLIAEQAPHGGAPGPGAGAAAADPVARLATIPGVGQRTAEGILAEIGTDLSRFPSAGNLASWAGLCPGQDESAGKRRSGKTRKGSPWLRTLLVEAANAARTKDTALSARYRRLAARRGRQRALVAVAHTILIIVYHLLTEETVYRELGSTYYDDRNRTAVERRLVQRLERLGHAVTLSPAAA